MADAVATARDGRGPVVVEAATYRWHGHYEGDPERYRTPEELEEWKANDPLVRHAQRAAARRRRRRGARRSGGGRGRRARCGGRRGPRAGEPRGVSTLGDFVVRPRADRAEPRGPAVDAPVFRTMDADPIGARSRAGDRRSGVRRRHRRGGRRQRVRSHAGAGRAVPRARARHPDLRDGGRRPRRGRGDGRDAPGGRGDVPRLPRRLLRPAPQPGGQAAVHDRWRRRDGAHRPHPVRGRPLVGQPALAEPRSPPGPHPRAHGGHAVDPGRHLRPAPGGDPGPEPRRVHREPAALRHEGPATARTTSSCPSVSPRSCAPAPT